MDAVASPPFLSVAQLGERLGVSTRTAYNLVNSGEVPVIELNGLKRIPAAALDQWLADRAAEAPRCSAARGPRSVMTENERGALAGPSDTLLQSLTNRVSDPSREIERLQAGLAALEPSRPATPGCACDLFHWSTAGLTFGTRRDSSPGV